MEKDMKVSCGKHNYKGECFQANVTDMEAVWWYAFAWREPAQKKKSFNDCHSRTPAAKIIPSLNQSLQNTSFKRKNVNFISFSTLPSSQLHNNNNNKKRKFETKKKRWQTAFETRQIAKCVIWLHAYLFSWMCSLYRCCCASGYVSSITKKKVLKALSILGPNSKRFRTSKQNVNAIVFDYEKCLKIISIQFSPYCDNNNRLLLNQISGKKIDFKCEFNWLFHLISSSFHLWNDGLWYLKWQKTWIPH